eukprot:5013957-Prymnesium_polylepis.1
MPASKVAAATVIPFPERSAEVAPDDTSKASHLIALSLLVEEASRDSPQYFMPASPRRQRLALADGASRKVLLERE